MRVIRYTVAEMYGTVAASGVEPFSRRGKASEAPPEFHDQEHTDTVPSITTNPRPHYYHHYITYF